MVSTVSTPFVIPNFLQGIRFELHGFVHELTMKIQQTVSRVPFDVMLTGQWLFELNSKLSRKEWSTWLGNALGWNTTIARQLINVAVAFKNFAPSQLSGIEPQSLFRVSAKKYREHLERLCAAEIVTQEAIDQLLQETRQKQETKPQTHWRQTKAGGGRYLKFHANLHDEETGMLIELILEEQGITQQEFLKRATRLMAGQKHHAGVEEVEPESIDTLSAHTEIQKFETAQFIAEQRQDSDVELEVEPESIDTSAVDTETWDFENEFARDAVAGPLQMFDWSEKSLQEPLSEASDYRSLDPEVLAEALRLVTTWEEAKSLAQQYSDVKTADWKLLPREKRHRIKRMKPFDAVAELEVAKSEQLIFDYHQSDGIWLVNLDGHDLEPVCDSGLPLFLWELRATAMPIPPLNSGATKEGPSPSPAKLDPAEGLEVDDVGELDRGEDKSADAAAQSTENPESVHICPALREANLETPQIEAEAFIFTWREVEASLALLREWEAERVIRPSN